MRVVILKSNSISIGNYSLIPRNIPEFFLLSVNLLPLLGIWFWGWKLLDIFILYWAESLIIGFYWFAKLITTFILDKDRKQWLPLLVFTFFFFLIHFGGFMFGHLIVIMSLIVFPDAPANLSVIFMEVRDSLVILIIPLILLFISHGFSFVHNFIIRKEYETWVKNRNNVRSAPPYGRIAVMHVSVFLISALMNTGIFIASFSSIFIVITKIITDLRGHRIEHGKVNN